MSIFKKLRKKNRSEIQNEILKLQEQLEQLNETVERIDFRKGEVHEFVDELGRKDYVIIGPDESFFYIYGGDYISKQHLDYDKISKLVANGKNLGWMLDVFTRNEAIVNAFLKKHEDGTCFMDIIHTENMPKTKMISLDAIMSNLSRFYNILLNISNDSFELYRQIGFESLPQSTRERAIKYYYKYNMSPLDIAKKLNIDSNQLNWLGCCKEEHYWYKDL
jgi:hypothetical protein